MDRRSEGAKKMIVNDINELSIICILDRGIANKEAIAISVNEDVDLGQYGIMLGLYDHSNRARPFQDSMFWFGDGMVTKGDWLFINTGEGDPRKTESADHLNNVFSLYWNKAATVFANSNVVPILFRVDAVDVLSPPENVPHIAEPRRLVKN
jgi:hypothetical protein